MSNERTSQLKQQQKYREKSRKFYGVAIGKTPGVYETWGECKQQTDSVRNAQFKSFTKKEDALTYVLGAGASSQITNIDSSSSEKADEENTTNVPHFSITMNFDGGSRGNGKLKYPVAGSGAILNVTVRNAGVRKEHQISMRKFLEGKDGFEMTNNYAEYEGLIIGLHGVKNFLSGVEEDCVVDFRVKGDSLLITNQMSGKYKCKSENIRPSYEEARGLVDEIRKLAGGKRDAVTFEHVFREQNLEADLLANEAMDQKKTWNTMTTSEDSQ